MNNRCFHPLRDPTGPLTVRFLIWLSVLIWLCLTPQLARASWAVDPARFHASAHGQMSCLACHETVAEKALHPDPRNMGKEGKDAFSPETCLYCHDGIMDTLEAGSHGSLRVDDPEEYQRCIGCHNPHTVIRLGDQKAGRLTPGQPVDTRCGSCHDVQWSLPPPSSEDAACMTCHATVDDASPDMIERENSLCLHCHGRSGTQAQAITAQILPLIDTASHESSAHGKMACTACHREAKTLTHHEQQPVTCGRCHMRHDEKKTHDLHLRISCQACHLKDVRAVRDAATHRIGWEKRLKGQPFDHEMVRYDDNTTCQRCHFPGNDLGAVAMTLPSKGILCMPCHTSTFSADDPITLAALIIFCVGLVLFFALFLSGSLSRVESRNPLANLIHLLGRTIRVILSSKILIILRSLFWDVFLQRRLYLRSPARWLIHALIFYAFVFRFLWGILALLGTLWRPSWPVVWDLVNKNEPVTAFFFDLTGLILLLGVVLAFIRGTLIHRRRAPGLPQQDLVALGLIGSVVIVGFILEGMRIALTGYPEGAAYAFVGYGIGWLFSTPRGLTEVYGFTWYIHAALTGAFIAYIPFSRLLHIIIAPLVLPMQAVSAHHGAKETQGDAPKGESHEN